MPGVYSYTLALLGDSIGCFQLLLLLRQTYSKATGRKGGEGLKTLVFFKEERKIDNTFSSSSFPSSPTLAAIFRQLSSTIHTSVSLYIYKLGERKKKQTDR